MNAELIDLYRGVQNRRGEWKRFDSCWHDIYGPGMVTKVFKYSLWVLFEKDPHHIELIGHEAHLLYLPPVWSEDGRCLLKILESRGASVAIESANGSYAVFCYYQDREQEVATADTLPEALLRAIREQEAGDANG